MSIWWSLHLRREAASVPLARRLLLGAMETAGVDPEISFDLSVALTEACANAVEHGGTVTTGGSTPGRPGEYRVTAYLDGEKCRIEVADSGPGFPAGRSPVPAGVGQDGGRDGRNARKTLGGVLPGATGGVREPVPAGAEHGRGLCLIEELADHVRFDNRPGRGGAVVSFDKILKWQDGAPLVAV